MHASGEKTLMSDCSVCFGDTGFLHLVCSTLLGRHFNRGHFILRNIVRGWGGELGILVVLPVIVQYLNTGFGSQAVQPLVAVAAR